MNFTEAMKLLIAGAKVRRTCWQVGDFISCRGDAIVWNTGVSATFRLSQISAEDWEVYIEQEKSLSDCVFSVSKHNSNGSINEDYMVFGADTKVIVFDDVRLALNKYFRWLRNFGVANHDEAKREIFGDKFISDKL